jgi:hypothetical protein
MSLRSLRKNRKMKNPTILSHLSWKSRHYMIPRNCAIQSRHCRNFPKSFSTEMMICQRCSVMGPSRYQSL